MNYKSIQNQIIEALPQLQCKKCEYPDCKSYAISLIEKNEKTRKIRQNRENHNNRGSRIQSGARGSRPSGLEAPGSGLEKT